MKKTNPIHIFRAIRIATYFSCWQVALFLAVAPVLPSPAFADEKSAKSVEGKIVRSITVQIGEIFYKDPVPAVYRFVNDIKIQTDPEIIRRELLFAEGEQVTDFQISETSRVLWSLPFIREVEIDTVVDGDYVDITVFARETWTLIPQMSFSFGDGRDRLSAGVADSNVLGQGNRLEFLHRQDEDIESLEAVWDDRRVLGSNTDLTVGIFDRTDGDRFFTRFEKPFRTLLNRQAWSSQLDTFDGVGRLWKDGEENFVYRTESIDTDFTYTTSRGNPSRNVHRFTMGYRYLESKFNQATLADIEEINLEPEELNQDPSRVASDRRFSGPLLAYANIQPDYIARTYVDRFQRVQNLNLGDQLGVLVHFAPEALGSLEDTLLLSVTRSKGHRVGPDSFIRGELSGSTRTTEREFENSLFELELLYFELLGQMSLGDLYLGRHTFGASFNLDFGDDFDLDRQLSLGADNGLRGYDARTFNGDKRLVLNIEDRVHLAEDVFELFNFGVSFFADLGGTTYESFGNLLQDELYPTVGTGILIGFPRSSGGRVLRLDFALPFRDGPDDTMAFSLRFIVSGGQVFDAELDSETRNADRPSVAVGF